MYEYNSRQDVYEKMADENLSAFRETRRNHGFMALRRFTIMQKREEKRKEREERGKRLCNLSFLY